MGSLQPAVSGTWRDGPDHSHVLQRAQLMQSAGEGAVGISGSAREHQPIRGGGSEPVLTPFAGAFPMAGRGCDVSTQL